MKQITLLLLVLATMLSFSSCGDDDDDSKKSITGTWVYKSTSVALESNSTDEAKNEKVVNAIIAEMDDDFGQIVMNFNSDGTCDANGDKATYTFENNILTVIYTDDDGSHKETFKYADGTLIMENCEEWTAYDINNLELDVFIRLFQFNPLTQPTYKVTDLNLTVFFKKK